MSNKRCSISSNAVVFAGVSSPRNTLTAALGSFRRTTYLLLLILFVILSVFQYIQIYIKITYKASNTQRPNNIYITLFYINAIEPVL